MATRPAVYPLGSRKGALVEVASFRRYPEWGQKGWGTEEGHDLTMDERSGMIHDFTESGACRRRIDLGTALPATTG